MQAHKGSGRSWELNVALTNLVLVFSNSEVIGLMIYYASNAVLSDIILYIFPQTFMLVILNTGWRGRKNN